MMMRGGDRYSGRKLEVELVVMRGRGGWTRAGARGKRERRRGGEGECMQKRRDTLRLDGGKGGDDGGGRGVGGSGKVGFEHGCHRWKDRRMGKQQQQERKEQE